MNKFQTDITIVGAGIVGCSLALALAPLGVKIALLDAGKAPQALEKDAPYRTRVSAINLSSVQFLKNLGVWPAIEAARASAYTGMQVWDAQSNARIDFDSEQTDHDQLGYIIENDVLVDALLTDVSVHENITVQHQSAVVSIEAQTGSCSVTTTTSTINCQLVVGADGQHSKVRSLANIATEIGHFQQQAIVARISTEIAHQQTAFQCFHESGPLAYLPLNDGSSSIVWSCDDGEAKQLLPLKTDQLAQRVAENLDYRLGEVQIESPVYAFPLKQIHALRYIGDRIALAGDAAHRTHPLAGLGANIGLLDAAALAQVISEKHSAKRDIGLQRNLRPYERWRRSQNTAILGAMQGFKSVFGSSNPTLCGAREATMNAVDANNHLKSLCNDFAMGTGQQRLSDIPLACRVKPPYA
ncbi:MAG: 2-octaprenylphenol hydroxylase [Saprospiraceae bacterium]|jgi:2-octaprenylphenol hydroxylase